MRINPGLALTLTFFLFACQPAVLPTVTIIDNDQVITLQTEELDPYALISQAGINLDEKDQIFSNGFPILPDETIAEFPITLQIRHAVTLTLVTPDGQQSFETSALTVGEALTEAGITIHEDDMIEPSPSSPITAALTINYLPSQILTVSVDGKSIKVKSTAKIVGEALAETGIPLLGLDYSLPSENEELPADGQIKVVRVNESIVLVQKSIPFDSELVASADIPLDQTRILTPGENGLSMQRVRIRYEDGAEISRITEGETVVRPPKNRKLAFGTKVEIKTTTVNGVTIEYWRAVQMYATSYSPCRLGTSTCGSTTASGKQLEKGVVALRTDLYRSLKGQPLYIPGYGYATVEDACGGCVGQPWIDLGYSDEDYETWHSVVTVYFLTPVPQNIIYDFE